MIYKKIQPMYCPISIILEQFIKMIFCFDDDLSAYHNILRMELRKDKKTQRLGHNRQNKKENIEAILNLLEPDEK
jgi:hypothetical protein